MKFHKSSSSTLIPILIILLVSCASVPSPAAAGKDGSCFFEAIYSFGDSTADTGNLIREGTGPSFSAITRLPYGMSAFDKPTGRYSDGFLMLDHFAMGLNLPLVSPYLDKETNFDHGVNFAVAGANALDKSFFMEKGIVLPYTNSSLDVQLQWFDEYINSTCNGQESPRCAEKFHKSLFFVGEIGGNDFNYAFFMGRPIDEVNTLVPVVVDKIVHTAKKVIDAGGLHLVIPGNYPIGCMPIYLTLFRSDDTTAYDEYKCLKDLNSFAAFHNQELSAAVMKLSKEYPQVTIMYADYYNAMLSLLRKTGVFPFYKSSLLRACCGAGGGDYNFNLSAMCGAPETTVCQFPSRSVSWDGVHLTGEANKMMTRELTFGGKTYPNNELWKKWICVQKIS